MGAFAISTEGIRWDHFASQKQTRQSIRLIVQWEARNPIHVGFTVSHFVC